jgi:hypothetical protein
LYVDGIDLYPYLKSWMHIMRGTHRSLGVIAIILLASLNLALLQSMPGVEALDYSMDSPLAEADASFEAEDLWNSAGYSVDSAGDVNGDGFDDMLIGAPWNQTGGWGTGQAYLILGKASGWSVDTSLAEADASFLGSFRGDRAGSSVAGVGDVNGDGYDDILVSAPYNNTDGSMSGQIYLILGKASGWQQDTPLEDSDASFIGESGWHYTGNGIAGAGDINGDGFDDMLIGAPYGGSPDWGRGKTYIIFGKASGWEMGTSLSDADASYVGDSVGDYTGWSLAGAGDVNGDNYDDILIGAPYNDSSDADRWSAGSTYLILGRPTGWDVDMSLSGSNASFVGETISDSIGISVSGTGDVNGDGLDDFLIGAPYCDKYGFGTGLAYLILGKRTGWQMDTDLSQADASFFGENQHDNLGFSVSGAGDVNGDGFDDMLIGAPGNDTAGMTAGQTYLILGRGAGWQKDTDITSSDASFIGEDDYDMSGKAVAGAGDVNGDGYDDIMIGAPWWNISNGYYSGKVYLILPDHNERPASVTSLKAFTDNTYTTETSVAYMDETVFLELEGTDGDPDTRDIALVNVENQDDSPVGFDIRLMETGSHTGIYRGGVMIKDRTNEDYGWVRASVTETIGMTSVSDPSKTTSVTIIDSVVLVPLVDNGTAREDEPYNAHYEATGLPLMDWTFDTNASWLEWDDTDHNLSGVPDNRHVGPYWVRINVTDAFGQHDEHNFTLTVENVAPAITTDHVTVAVEDQEYVVDYNSTDDGQGDITWHLEMEANDWLTMNSTTGVVNGTPGNEHVGEHVVNISVDDGNGGTATSQFVLTVRNTNNRPAITTEDVMDAYEDSMYAVDYEAVDLDDSEVLTWGLDTDAGQWLSLDPSTGNLSGTPTNDDVGTWWVNVSVQDTLFALDHHNFTLTVHNTNDLPVITSRPVIEAKTMVRYEYNVTAEDVDVGDILTYTLDIGPEGMEVNEATGLIEWIPPKGMEGTHSVIVSVSDGNASVTQSYGLVVTANDPPVITSHPPTRAYLGLNYIYQLEVQDPDGDSVGLYMLTGPDGMMVDGKRQVSWSPDRMGDFDVIVLVRDEHGATYSQSWTITVSEMPILSVHISHPAQDGKVWGTVRIGGTAATTSGQVTCVQVKVGDSDWMVAMGTLAWYLDMDTSDLTEGELTISARSSDGQLWSEPVEVVVTVEEPAAVDDGPLKTVEEDLRNVNLMEPCWGLILLVAIGTVILLVWRRQTRRPPTYRPPSTDEEDPVELDELVDDDELEDQGGYPDEETSFEDMPAGIEVEEVIEFECPHCGRTVGENDELCAECGTEFESEAWLETGSYDETE